MRSRWWGRCRRLFHKSAPSVFGNHVLVRAEQLHRVRTCEEIDVSGVHLSGADAYGVVPT